jgi:drug/metabolite transporter (DMT)-like permease
MPAITWVFALVSIMLSALAQLSMKIGMTRIREGGATGAELARQIALSPHVIGGLAMYGVGAVLWLAVLSRAPLSMAYPLVSLGFVFVSVLAWTVLGESLPLLRVAGIACILLGVAMVGLGQAS